MDTHTMKRTSSRVRSVRHDCCEEKCPAGSRNNYFLGKHLTPDSYRLEQRYSIKRRRLANRAIHGWGVVYGFALTMAEKGGKSTLEPGELGIGEGFALDALGRELIQVHGTVVSLDNLLVLGEDGKPVRADGKLDERLKDLAHGKDDCWLLSAHYAEQTIGPVTLKDPCSCDRTEWDQICETIVYSLKRIDCKECCTPWKCELDCDCPPDSGCCAERHDEREKLASEHEQLTNDYEERLRKLEESNPAEAAKLREEYEKRLVEEANRRHESEEKRHPRGGCACLCEDLTRLEFGADCVRLSDVDDCTHADLGHGVKLACLSLDRDKCGDWAITGIIDACGPRQLVKRNDLLFDLINGCDVTRIVKVGWGHWHRRVQPVPFDAFVDALGWVKGTDDEEYVTRDFWVKFSRPVRADTLTPDAFAMAIMSDQTEGCWREYYRVPIVAVELDDPESGDPPGHVRVARMVISGGWLSDGVLGRGSVFRQGETHVEIEVRGDFIEDCLGQTVDANPRGRSPYPTGSDGPGDTYLSTFTVARRIWDPEPEQRATPKPRRRPPAAS
jgi:hypothetical protein